MKRILLVFSFSLLHFKVTANNKSIDRLISNTNYQFEKVRDFQAKMSVRLNVPGLRMPKKTYKVYYKHPNKFKADTLKVLVYYLIQAFSPLQKTILTI